MSKQPPEYDADGPARPVSSALTGFSFQLLDGRDLLQVWREAVGEAVARLAAEGAFGPGDALRLESAIGASPRERGWIDAVARVTVERAEAYDATETIGVARAMLLTAVPDATSEPKPVYAAGGEVAPPLLSELARALVAALATHGDGPVFISDADTGWELLPTALRLTADGHYLLDSDGYAADELRPSARPVATLADWSFRGEEPPA